MTFSFLKTLKNKPGLRNIILNMLKHSLPEPSCGGDEQWCLECEEVAAAAAVPGVGGVEVPGVLGQCSGVPSRSWSDPLPRRYVEGAVPGFERPSLPGLAPTPVGGRR